ncbi:DUF4138 domain-containing protein [Mucilaginibacter myungsuensis]|uniref:DUF4138 domain-containing protein n=1 Tax=Mucilaginibacter myungsuensis TaxID=649104 RepID=A0A929KXI1_9SPHI|nr:DUF4138 domain-containing protein [Mucilaginibacter myungsuensis]MBE9662997.1 DUF4138 domain-containing protein [Mucilaginibacter myungsuensis]MDN3598627.1 DUF4138 domain-containing protein [Mucilaginibacter myungsuensis]
MKRLTVIFFLALIGKIAFAQDTAYISQDKATALFFPGLVKVLGSQSSKYVITDKGNGVLTIKAVAANFKTVTLSIQDQSTKKVYSIPVVYSYGRAGRRIGYGTTLVRTLVNNRPENTEEAIAQQLALGKRADVATHEKSGGIKAWINKVSLAGNRVYLRLDLRNRSNLPYGIDFVRFYIRDRKTVDRMATHEQEIVPLYSTLRSRTAVTKDHEVAKVFAFKRFSLSDDEALFIEVYERSGNRHLYLQIRQDDLDDIKVLAVPSRAALTLAAN